MTASWPGPSIPFRRPGEPNSGTWAGDSANQRTGVNVWGFMTVDAKRGIVYMPFGAPSGDLFGGDRPGNDLYDTSIVAADAKTGKYLWHFQVVHHDIWDFDLETPPVLMDVKKNGKTIPAVAVFGKSSLLFLLDRVNGKPIYDVTEKPVAQSDVPGEQLSPTQPFPSKPGPLARDRLQYVRHRHGDAGTGSQLPQADRRQQYPDRHRALTRRPPITAFA